MADTVIEKEDIELLKPLGMTCLYDQRYQCGTYDSLEQYYDHDGDKWCKNMCLGRKGKPGHNKTADEVNDGLAHQQSYWGNAAYKIALENSVNNGLLSMKKLDTYKQYQEQQREKGRRQQAKNRLGIR